MKEILCLCHTIVNGPLPPSTLWQASAEVILRTLGLPEPSSFPTSEEYSKFVLMPLTNQLAATAEANLEDDHELCNEISTLKRLEVGMHAVAATDEPDGTSSTPSMADNATMQVIEDSELSSNEDADSMNGNNEGVDGVHNGNSEDQSTDGEADGIQKCSKFPVDKEWGMNEFWMENSQPKSLPSIKTIFKAIHFPAQMYNQQKPTMIWQEFMKLYILGLSEQVCTIPCAPLPTRPFLLGGE